MHRFKVIYCTVLIVVVLFVSSCNKEDISDDAARLRVKLTDASTLVLREFHIEIDGIEVFATDSVNIEGEWVPLEYSGGEYSLLTLMNGKTVQIVDQYFPAEKSIEKIRINFGNNNRMITVTDSIIQLRKYPQIADGVVIDNLEVELAPHIITSIIIDINAALSIREHDGEWFLNPAARAFPETYGGQIKGYVSPREASSFVAIIQDTDTFMTFPENDGLFLFFGLNEGPWEIHLAAIPNTNYTDTVFNDTISAGEKKDLKPNPIRLPFVSSP